MSGLSAMDTKASGRLGILTITYYLWTTFIAVIVGIVLVLIIHPGTGSEKEGHHGGTGPVMTSADALLDLIRYLDAQAPAHTHAHTCTNAHTHELMHAQTPAWMTHTHTRVDLQKGTCTRTFFCYSQNHPTDVSLEKSRGHTINTLCFSNESDLSVALRLVKSQGLCMTLLNT